VIVEILAGGSILGLVVTLLVWLFVGRGQKGEPRMDKSLRATWQMPPLSTLPPGRFSASTRVWMGVLRAYLVVAGGLVLVRIVQLALGHG